MIETARNSTQRWELDQMGHMNVQFYADRAADGLAAIAIKLGMNRVYAVTHNCVLVPVRQRTRFLRERVVGSPFFLRGGVTHVEHNRITVYQEMVDTSTNDTAATFITQVEARDPATHAPCALPPGVLERAAELKLSEPTDHLPNGLTPEPADGFATLPEAVSAGTLPTFQAPIHSDQCDRYGWLRPRHFMGIASNAVPSLLAQVGGAGRGRRDVGGAALQFRFVHERYPRAGDVVVMRSGISRIGDKTYNFRHWLFDLASGTVLARAETVIATLDLKARKIMPLSADTRAQLQAHLLTGKAR